MGYKLIASDLDETLLDDRHSICERNLELIKKAREEYGIKFVPATGRGYAGITRELQLLELYDLPDEYSLSMNGGILTENKDSRIISFKGVTYAKVKEIFDFGTQQDVCIHIYTTDEVYVYNMNKDERNRFIKQGISYLEIDTPDIDFLKEQRIAKILYQNIDVPYLMTLEPKMQDIVADQIAVSYSSNRYMEFNKKGVDKGQGLLELANILGIDSKDTIAVGDNYNDMAMLKVAGLSVAAANAVQDIKDICDYTTEADNNEGVLAEVIEKFILTEKG